MFSRRMMKAIGLGSVIAIALLAVCFPAAGLPADSPAGALCVWVSGNVPGVAAMAKGAELSLVISASLTGALLFAMATFLMLVATSPLPFDRHVVLPWKRKWASLGGMAAVVLGVLLIAWLGASVPDKPVTRVLNPLAQLQWAARESRAAIFVYSVWCYGMTAYALAVLAGVVKNFRRLWLRDC